MEALLRYLHPENPGGPGTIGKVLENFLLVWIIKEVSGCRLVRDEQSGFRPKHSTSLQQARLFERGSGNTGEKRHTGAFYLDVDKAFDIIRDDGLMYKLTVLNLFSYLVKSILPTRSDFEASFQTATSCRRCMRVGLAQGGLISPALFSRYVNDCLSLPTTSSYLSMRTTRSQPRSASQRCVSGTWNLNSATSSVG